MEWFLFTSIIIISIIIYLSIGSLIAAIIIKQLHSKCYTREEIFICLIITCLFWPIITLILIPGAIFEYVFHKIK